MTLMTRIMEECVRERRTFFMPAFVSSCLSSYLSACLLPYFLLVVVIGVVLTLFHDCHGAYVPVPDVLVEGFGVKEHYVDIAQEEMGIHYKNTIVRASEQGGKCLNDGRWENRVGMGNGRKKERGEIGIKKQGIARWECRSSTRKNEMKGLVEKQAMSRRISIKQ